MYVHVTAMSSSTVLIITNSSASLCFSGASSYKPSMPCLYLFSFVIILATRHIILLPLSLSANCTTATMYMTVAVYVGELAHINLFLSSFAGYFSWHCWIEGIVASEKPLTGHNVSTRDSVFKVLEQVLPYLLPSLSIQCLLC